MNTRSVPVVAALLFVLVALLLGGALLFVRRDSVAVGPVASGAQPTPPPAQTALATAAPTLAAATAQPTQAPAPATPTRSPATPTPPLALALTATPIVMTATPAPGQSAAKPQGTLVLEVNVFRINGTEVVVLPGTPTPVIPWYQIRRDTPEALVKALVDGYLYFWQVRAEALMTMQTSLTRQVMTDGPLEDELAAMERFRAQNQAQRVDVGHSITVLWAVDGEGAVIDALTDRSTMVDLTATPQPTETPPASSYRMAYRLRRSTSGWQVVDSIRIVR